MAELETGLLPPLDEDKPPEPKEGFLFGAGSSGETPKRRGRPPGSANKKKLAELEQPLADKIVEYMGYASFASPLALAVAEERADRTAKAMIRLAARSPRILKGINTFIEGSDYVVLISFPIAIATAVAVDWNRLQPDSKPARVFNIDKYWKELYGQEGTDVPPEAVPIQRRGLLG